MSVYPQAIRRLVGQQDLDRGTASALMSELMEGLLEQSQVAAVLTALAAKGETAQELAGFAEVMRRHMISIDAEQPVLDTCGTGGSGLETVNTSTLCAFIAAAAGVRVAKHGNRASSGKCGSMDVLEHLGVNIELTPQQAQNLLGRHGIVFMYARRHHPALGQVTPVRRALGFRTSFNFLGPICNPARVRLQMMGVSDPRRAPLLLDSLKLLDTERAVVAWGEDGLDEITLTGPTRLWELRDGGVTERTIQPEEFGLERVPFSRIQGGDIATNVRLFEAILTGEEQGARRDHTALNAGASLYVAGVADSIAAGLERAKEILERGDAWAIFEAYRHATRGAEI